MQKIPLFKVFENPSNGIIHALENFDVPWKSNLYYIPMDEDYIYNYSATKIVSRMVQIFLNADKKLSQTSINILAETIYKMYSRKWEKLYQSYNFQYNPIENYDMTENMIDDITEHDFDHTNTRTDNLQSVKQGGNTVTHNTTDTRTDNLQSVKQGGNTVTHNTTDTRTDDLQSVKQGGNTVTHNTTDTRTDDLTAIDENKVEGFNSNEYQPSTYEQIDNTGTQTIRKTGTDSTQENSTDTNTGTQTMQKTGTDSTQENSTDTNTGTQIFKDTGKNTDTRNYELRRHGNIGVTTSQQMIQSERDLWEFNFVETVYKDIDRVLTIAYFDINDECENGIIYLGEYKKY